MPQVVVALFETKVYGRNCSKILFAPFFKTHFKFIAILGSKDARNFFIGKAPGRGGMKLIAPIYLSISL